MAASSSDAALQSGDAATLDTARRTTFAAEIFCGKNGRFRCELYDFGQAKTDFAGGRRFWHLRWLVDFLGGTNTSNFLGQSIDPWTNRIIDRIQWLMPDAQEEQIGQEAAKHILSSSWSRRKTMGTTKKRKDRNSDRPDSMADPADTSTRMDALPCQEFAASTFAFLVIVGHWAFRGPKTTQKWKLGHDMVKDRCFTLLNAIMDQFLQDEGELITPEGLKLNFRAGLVDVHRLSKSHRNLNNSFSGLDQWATVMDMLKSMTQDELNGNLGKPRKAISSTCIARFYEHLAAVIDTEGSSHRVWTSISIKQMDQLRTQSTLGVVIIATLCFVIYSYSVLLLFCLAQSFI